jgi:hypothetical protein
MSPGYGKSHGKRRGAVTHVHVEATCKCPFAIAEEYARQYLERAERGGAEAALVVGLPGVLPALVRHVNVSFTLARDIQEAGRLHDEIRLRWLSGSPLYPDFRGTLRFRIAGVMRTGIILDGSYHPPFGIAGRVFDMLVGRWIAKRTLTDLAARLSSDLEEKELAWRRAHPINA